LLSSEASSRACHFPVHMKTKRIEVLRLIASPWPWRALFVLLIHLGISSGALAADWRINSGGPAAGAFAADGHVSGGMTIKTSAAIDVSRVHSPAPQEVYQSERRGDFTYTVQGLTPGAFYTVRMHFTEFLWKRAGARVLNVTINGTSALSNFDIFAVAGTNHVAIVEEFLTKPDTHGVLKIVYQSVVGAAKSSGLEILRSPAPPDTPVIRQLKETPAEWSPDGSRYLINNGKQDQNGIYQLYVGQRGDKAPICPTHLPMPGGPRPDRHKVMASWHPSGQWIVLGGERAEHDNMWIPAWLRKGWSQCGIWMDMYATTPGGSRWYKLAPTKGGFTGVAFTPDGKLGMWADFVDGNVLAYPAFGRWRLMLGEFVESNGVPSFQHLKDISPPGAIWLEPGNFSPDGQSLLITADIGIKDNQGMDQYILNIKTGQLTNLTKSPSIWDEHGVFSPDGRQVFFMSSYPYRNDPRAHQIFSLKTEFMLINVDGTGLRQLTHFGVSGYPESFPHGHAEIAAVGMWSPDGTSIFCNSIAFPDDTYWEITFPTNATGSLPATLASPLRR